jgi:small subunit ribosomal protein S1
LQAKPSATSEETSSSSVADVASLSSMLKARWKSGPASGVSKEEQTRTGQIRSFRITKLDPASKRIHLELA